MNTLWKYIPTALAHELAPLGLSIYADLFGAEIPEWMPLTWKGLHFLNRLGIAGGVDKNATSLELWPRLGAGFVEVGTVTPKPQDSNPGKIMGRDWNGKALWNKMGFPSDGANAVYYSLRREHRIPVFVNIGKNRTTPNEKAVEDYLACVSILESQADAFVVNVSSPNTKGLRDLQNKQSMQKLVHALVARTSKPVLVKLSPDMTDEQLQDVLHGCLEGGASGFVLTNTTLSRTSDMKFPTEGGVSGLPLANKSKAILKKTIQILGAKRKGLLIISVGGVLNANEVFERLRMGADLVQTYSGLVFNGPKFFHDVATAAKEISAEPPIKEIQ